MTTTIRIVSSGNTLAPALAILRKLGYEVTRHSEVAGNDLLYATRATITLVAEDPLSFDSVRVVCLGSFA